MVLVPLTIITGIFSLVTLIIWSIQRQKMPGMTTLILIVVSALSFLTGIFYIIAPVINILAKYNLWNYNITLSDEEILGTAVIAGLVFLFIGLDQLIKSYKRKN